MYEVAIYFAISGMGIDEEGNPCEVGGKLTIGESEKRVDYEKLIEGVTPEKLLKATFLEGMHKPEDLRIITEEEYLEEFGNDEEELEEDDVAEDFMFDDFEPDY